MIDWKNVDFAKLETFESKAYKLCTYDNIYFDCSEKLCSKCILCPLDKVTGDAVNPETMQRIHKMFMLLAKAHCIEDLTKIDR